MNGGFLGKIANFLSWLNSTLHGVLVQEKTVDVSPEKKPAQLFLFCLCPQQQQFQRMSHFVQKCHSLRCFLAAAKFVLKGLQLSNV